MFFFSSFPLQAFASQASLSKPHLYRTASFFQDQNDWTKLLKAALDYLAQKPSAVSSFAPLPSYKQMVTLKVRFGVRAPRRLDLRAPGVASKHAHNPFSLTALRRITS
jgi:hypothetical protein